MANRFISFNDTNSLEEALAASSSEPNKTYFPTDEPVIVKNGKTIGMTSSQQTQLGKVPTMEQSITGLNTNIETIKSAATALTNRVATAETTLTNHGKSISSLQADLYAVITSADAATKNIAALQTSLSEVAASVAELNELYADRVEGFIRVAGTSDPALSYKQYANSLESGSVFDIFRPCLIEVGTGKLLYVLNPLNYYEDESGNARAIDGSEGEVYITNIKTYYHITGHVTVGSVTYDVMLRSLGPFAWQGVEAAKVEPFGMSPDNCVAHADDDGVTRMHSVYNPDWNGSFTAQTYTVGKYTQSGVGDEMTEEYDASGALFASAGGLHSTDINLPTGEQYAMNLNEDTTKTVPFFNEHAAAVELMVGHIIAEGGTFDAHNAALMGSGFSANDIPSTEAAWEASYKNAVNGVRYVGSDGTTLRYCNFGRTGMVSSSTSTYIAQLLNQWRSPWAIMERHRVMFYALANGIPELTWFAFEGNKYKWRSVDGFAGPNEGVLTCVVTKVFSTVAGADMIDYATGESIEDNRIDFMVSGALYRGWNTDVSPSRWDSGIIMTEDDSMLYTIYYQPDQAKLLKSSTQSNVAADTVLDFETQYDRITTIQGASNAYGYRKDYNDACLLIPKDNDNFQGGGLHTHVGAYNWFTSAASNTGTRSVRGFRRGHLAYAGGLSPCALTANDGPSYAYSYFGFGTCVRVKV